MLGFRSAILNKPRASLCLLVVSFLLRLILQLAMTRKTSAFYRLGILLLLTFVGFQLELVQV